MLLCAWATSFTNPGPLNFNYLKEKAKVSKHVLVIILLFCCNMQMSDVRKTDDKGNDYYLTNRRHLVNPLQGSW